VGWEKVACWSTTAAISLKRVKIEEKLLWRAYRKPPTLFRTVPSPTPYSLTFPKIGGSQTHPKTAIIIIPGTAKATDANLADTFTGSIRTQAHDNVVEKGARAYPGTVQIFLVPPIISGMGKATNFNFGRYIQRLHANKSPLKILEKKEHGRIKGLPKFFEYPLLSQECIKLRTSNLAGIFTGSI